MSTDKKNLVQCQITGKMVPRSEAMTGGAIRHQIQKLILKDHPKWSPNLYTSWVALKTYRTAHVHHLLKKETDTISELEKGVLQSLEQQEILTQKLLCATPSMKMGDRISDRIAAIGGSWSFIIGFLLFLALWILFNSVILFIRPLDPYPFIFLNLILSCIAALQAPIIMMSQNRQAEKDRTQAEHDFKVNLKAEIEIRVLNEKIDHLMIHFSQTLLDIQELQTEMLEEIMDKMKGE